MSRSGPSWTSSTASPATSRAGPASTTCWWTSSAPSGPARRRPGSDVAEVALVDTGDLARYDLTPKTIEVVGRARALAGGA